MKPRNYFAALPEADRQVILKLCESTSYPRAVKILAQPRSEGGLGLVTSVSALCRFYTSHHPEPAREVLAQYATAAHVRHQQDSNHFLGAIRAAVEARVLESLRAGKALSDLEKDFKLLRAAQSLYHEDARWRTFNSKTARAAYNDHVERCARAPQIDFVTSEEAANEPHLPVPGEPHSLNFIELSPFDLDLVRARVRQKDQAEEQNRRICEEEEAEINGTQDPAPAVDQPGRDVASVLPQPSQPHKTPEIPHIPPNSSSKTEVAQASPGQAATAASVPATNLKIGRNEPCPCGSERKYKHCCLLTNSERRRGIAA